MLPGAPDPLQNQKRNGEEIAGELRSTAMLAPTFLLLPKSFVLADEFELGFME